jgi:hypothetical protein
MQSKNKDGNIQKRGTDMGTIYRNIKKKCGVNNKMTTKPLTDLQDYAFRNTKKKINAHMSPGADSNYNVESSTPGKILKGGKNGRSYKRNC